MAASPDDRFAGLINSSAERGGWVPGDVFTADSEGEEEPVPPRRVRLPVLVSIAVATVAVLIAAFFVLRPADQHDPVAGEAGAGSGADSGDAEADGGGTTGTESGGAESGGADDDAQGAGATGTVVVHITGAVRTPSVVTLGAGSRVQDAVAAAGGLTGDAAAETVNLARILQDGEQIHIPLQGEAPPEASARTGGGGTAAGSGAGSGPGSGAGGQDGAAGTAGAGGHASADGQGADSAGGGAGGAGARINLNTADATALQTLPGVGPVTAEAIIAQREAQPFASVDDLLLVTGIGPKTFESLKDLVTVG